MKFQTDGRQTDRKGNGQTKFQTDGRTDRRKRKTEGQTDEILNRQKTDRKGRKTEKMMTDGGQKKDPGTDGQNFKQTEDKQMDTGRQRR